MLITLATPLAWNVRPDVCPHFVSGADLGNPWLDFFTFAHLHPLEGVDVRFGAY